MKKIFKEYRDALIVTLMFSIIIFIFNVFNIPCLVRLITGYPCPGCGMTRAWESVLKLDLSSAFRYHPLFLLAPALLFLSTNVSARLGKWRNPLAIGIFSVFLLVYIYRMIAFYPSTEPMLYYEGSLINRVIFFFSSFFSVFTLAFCI